MGRSSSLSRRRLSRGVLSRTRVQALRRRADTGRVPYAAFHPDAHLVRRPTREALDALAASPPSGLLLQDYPFESFEPLRAFARLEILKIQGAKALASLAGLEALTSLRVLVVAPGPERDVREIDSFAPLRSLRTLERLVLYAMRARAGDHAPIEAMTWLRELELTGPDLDVDRCARLAARLPDTSGRCLQPFTAIPGVGFCKRCSGRTVLLTGAPPRARAWLCPACNEKKLAEHVARFEAAKRAAAGT